MVLALLSMAAAVAFAFDCLQIAAVVAAAALPKVAALLLVKTKHRHCCEELPSLLQLNCPCTESQMRKD